jgi:hypothetical protein
MVGNSCISRANTEWDNRTYLLEDSSANANGTLTSWCIYVTTGGRTAKLKVFRSNGANWDYIGESSPVVLSNGLNTNYCNIPVLSGDYIGVYLNGSTETKGPASDVGAGIINTYYITDITSNTAKSAWDRYTSIIISLGATLSTLNDVYVDLNKADDTGAGTSWATAKKTMKAGWDILLATGTMHVASGDYSAQTTIAYNKSWKLSCEDPNSTGVKSVKIPKST